MLYNKTIVDYRGSGYDVIIDQRINAASHLVLFCLLTGNSSKNEIKIKKSTPDAPQNAKMKVGSPDALVLEL